MTPNLDLPGILLGQDGQRHPAKLVDLNDKGYIVLYSVDQIPVHGRYQLLLTTPRVSTVVRITSSEPSGNAYHLEAVCEDTITELRAKIMEHKLRGIIK